MLTKSNLLLNTLVAKLSVRAQKIILKLGGIQALLDYYAKNNSFHNLRSVGVLTEMELTSLCDYLSSSDIELMSNETDNIDDLSVDITSLSKYYLGSKDFLSARTKNVLTNLEKSYTFHAKSENKILFFKDHFMADFNFSDLPNIGVKSTKELLKLKDDLNNFLDQLDSKNTYPAKGLLIKQLDKVFNHKYIAPILETLINEDKYHFQKVLCILVKTNALAAKKRQIANIHFFKKGIYTLQEIADKVGCTRELVRIHLNSLDSDFIPSQINILRSNVTAQAFDLEEYTGKNCFDIPNIEEFVFEGNLISPNATLSKLIFRSVFNDKFELIDDLINDLHTENKSFDTEQVNVFVEKELIQRIRLKQLLDFLNIEIYNFESVGFEYDLRVLIQRYYRETNFNEVGQDDIDNIYRIIVKIKKSELIIDPKRLIRIEKKEMVNRIVSIAEELLLEKNTPLKTREILSVINANGINIDIQQLLLKLGSHKSTFIRIGNSLWWLKDLHHRKDLYGSLRTIVEGILVKRSSPIHISELIAIIQQMRPISLQSLVANLRASESKMFKFFCCSFIGLSSIRYDQYWYDIPRFVPAHLSKELRQLGKDTKMTDLSERMQEKYGYPKIHIEYLLAKRIGDEEIE